MKTLRAWLAAWAWRVVMVAWLRVCVKPDGRFEGAGE